MRPDYKTKNTVGALKGPQLSYTDVAKAYKQMQVLAIPDKVIADATSAQLVGKGNLLRVSGQSSNYIAFGDPSVAAPTVNSDNAVETPNDYFYIVATDNYVRTSVAMRIEVIEE